MVTTSLRELLKQHPPPVSQPWDDTIPPLPDGMEHGLSIEQPCDLACAACLEDVSLRSLCSPAAGGPCEFCGSTEEEVIRVDALFEYVYRCLLQEFGDPNLSDLLYDKEEEEWAGVQMLDTWEVLYHAGYPFGDATPLAQRFAEAVPHDWYELDSEVGTVDQRHLWSWKSFEDRLLSGPRFLFSSTTADWGEVSADDLFHFLAVLAAQLGPKIVNRAPSGQRLIRARSHKTNYYTTADDLGSPPPAKAVAQRMSAAGVSCFYAAEDESTAINEIRPALADVVSCGEWATTQPLVFVDFADGFDPPSLFDYIAAQNRPYHEILQAFVHHI